MTTLRSRLAFWLRNDAARLLWPARCLACGDRGGDGIDLCAACAAAPAVEPQRLPALRDPAAGPAAVVAGESAPVCGACLQHRAALARPVRAARAEVHAACVYAAPLDRLLPRFKFHHDLAAGGLLAQLMAQAFATLPRPDALVPVPLHRARLRQRGYDQALELARPLARALGLPLLTARCGGCAPPPRNRSWTPRNAGATSRTRSRCRPGSRCPRTWCWSTTS